ncbi:hypothetical protein [Sphingobacterium tabacisoli]|uniref:Porin n=1 Tax=Sphingobacterium tabacisoli TaxID=2044855 RepID=A0ABW5L3B8_9SPHI|nr:hypothetical protein [Sphingobacterium tabacisoli]
MKHLLRLIVFLISMLFSVGNGYLKAQEIGVKLDFFGYADNREYGTTYTEDKTIFGSLISPQLYFKLSDNHALYGGVHYNKDFGSRQQDKRAFNPIAYYNYTSTNIDFAIGFIPRYERLKNVPRVVLADTFMYDRPNLEGMFFKYRKEGFEQRVFIDWLSKQTFTDRERFMAGIAGSYHQGLFYVEHAGILYHNALTSNDDLDEHVQDNGVITANVGLDLSDKTTLDSLTIDAGAVVGFDRIRTKYDMQVTKGFISKQHLGYKKFGLTNTLYLGQAQNLPNGDPFYRRDKYDRVDLSWAPFTSKAIEAKLVVSFHFSKDQIDNQQAFTLRYNFGQSLWHK